MIHRTLSQKNLACAEKKHKQTNTTTTETSLLHLFSHNTKIKSFLSLMLTIHCYLLALHIIFNNNDMSVS